MRKFCFLFTIVYASSRQGDKVALWNFFKELNVESNKARIVGGDFNAYVEPH